jgi:hypothetical protein
VILTAEKDEEMLLPRILFLQCSHFPVSLHTTLPLACTSLLLGTLISLH